MLVITLCVGSSCYMRGAHQVAEAIERSIELHGLTAKVELQGAFCLGSCLDGVAACLDGQPLPRLTPTNIDEVFARYILKEA
ncbi:MAG: hypothetical protein DDT35_00311 [Firmicutes bacterium]|nr:hypothetical protein [Bacillota bacterium]